MATLTIGGKTVVTQTGTDEPIIGSDVVFPAGHVVQVVTKMIDDELTSIAEGFVSAFDINITANLTNSFFKYSITGSYYPGVDSQSASYILYVEKNNSGNNQPLQDSNNENLRANFGSYPDTGKLIRNVDGNHANPFSGVYFDYTSHVKNDIMKYRFYLRTQGTNTVMFNRAGSGITNDYQATTITAVIIEEISL